MQTKIKSQNSKATIVWAVISLVVVIMLIQFPEQSFQAALDGLKVWWDIVFPALLPFFIIAEILMGLGVVSFLGTLLEPLMRPVFNIPGEGAFAFAMGLASGYPLGASISRTLFDKKFLTKSEAERLICFCNTADPVFMIGAVAVGMFGNAGVGLLIVASHYISAIMVGIILSFLEKRPRKERRRDSTPILKKAWQRMFAAREADGRSFGDILGDSVGKSVESLLKVGGFIIFFNVLIRLLELIGFAGVLEALLDIILVPIFGKGLSKPLIGGILEVTIGCKLAAASIAPLLGKLSVTNAIIAWSGLSVHGQVAAMLQGTVLKQNLFIKARFLHAVLALLLTPLLIKIFPVTLPVWTGPNTTVGSFAVLGVVLGVAVVVSFIIDSCQKAKITLLRW